jgi:predicted enzyme related to lactoylglutathione lyase
MPRAREGYRQLLGREPRYSDDNWIEFALDGGVLALHLHGRRPEGTETTEVRYGALATLKVEDIGRALEQAGRAGFRQVSDLMSESYGKLVRIQDPWGNQVALHEPAA